MSYRKSFLVLVLLLLLSLSVYAQISADITAIRDRVVGVACTILFILEGVVGFIAILMFILAAIKWIVSEDPRSRAEVRETLAHILLGVVIVVLALELANVLGIAAGVITEKEKCSGLTTLLEDTEIIRGSIGKTICSIVVVLKAVFGIIGMSVLMIAGIIWITSEEPGQRIRARKLALNVILGLLIFLIGLGFLDLLFNLASIEGEYGFLTGVFNFNCSASGVEEPGILDDFTKYTLCMVFFIIRGVAGLIAVLAVMVAGIILMSSEDANLRNKAKSLLVSAVVGVIVVIIGAQFLVSFFNLNAPGPGVTSEIFDCSSFNANLPSGIIDFVNHTLCIIRNLIVAFAAFIAVIALLASAFIWLTSESPEARAGAKMASIAAVVGLLIVVIGAQWLGTFITQPVAGFFDFACPGKGVPPELFNVLKTLFCLIYNLLRVLITIVAAIMLLFGGFMLITSEGSTDRARAKNLMASAIIGFIIAMIASQFILVIMHEADLAGVADPGDSFCPDDYGSCIDDCITNEGEPDPRTGDTGALTTCVDGCVTAHPEQRIIHFVRFAVCIVLRIIQLLGVIASVLAITVSGIMWLSSDSASQRSTAKKIFMFALLGLVVIMIAVQLINAFIVLDDPTHITQLGCGTQIPDNIYTSIKTLACLLYRTLQFGAIMVAILLVMLAGLLWMGADSPEDRRKAKNIIFHVIVGLLIVMIAIHILGSVVVPTIGYSLNCNDIIESPDNIRDTMRYTACVAMRLLQFTVVVLAILVIMAAGVRFLVSDDPEDRQKAKKMIIYTIIGLLAAYMALNVINVILRGPLNFHAIVCDIDPTAEALPEIAQIRDQIHFVVCLIIQIILFVSAVIASLIVVLAGVTFFTSDDSVSKNKARILIIQVVIGLIIIFVATNLVNAIFSAAVFAPVSGEETTFIQEIFTNNCLTFLTSDIDISELEITAITDPINTVFCVFVTLFQSIVALIFILLIIAAGYRWAASDSYDERLKAKRTIIYGVIGITVIFLSTHIIYALISAVSGGLIDARFVNPLLPLFPGSTIETCHIENTALGIVVAQTESILCLIFLTAFLVSGIIVSMVIVYAGIKWMTSDSPGDRTEAKWMVIKAIIGFIVIQVASQFVFVFTGVLVSGVDIPGFNLGELLGFLGDLFGTPYLVLCFGKINLIQFDPITHLPTGVGGGAIGFGLLFAQIWLLFCYLLRMLQFVAFATAAVIIVLAGFRWMGSDSATDRADARRRILHVLVGLIIVIVATSIVDALSIFNILSRLPVIGPILDPIITLLQLDDLYGWWCPTWSDVLLGNVGSMLFSAQIQTLVCIIIRIIQGVAAAFATIVVILAGIQWMGSESYESRVNARNRIIHVVLGLLIIILALQIVNAMLEGGDWGGVILQLDCDTDYDEDVTGEANTLMCLVVRFLEGIVAVIAVVLIIIVGYKWMGSENPEDRVKARNTLFIVIVALVATVLALQMVQVMVTGRDWMSFDCGYGGVDCGSPSSEFEELLCSARTIGCWVIRFLEGLAGVLAALLFVILGYRFMTSAIPEERNKIKNGVLSVTLGLFVVILAFELVNVFVTERNIMQFTCLDAAPDCSAPADSFEQLLCDAIYIGCIVIRMLQFIVGLVGALVIAYYGTVIITTENPSDRNRAKGMVIAVLLAVFFIIAALILIQYVVFNTRVWSPFCMV